MFVVVVAVAIGYWGLVAAGTIVLMGLKGSVNTNAGLVCMTRAPLVPFAIYLVKTSSSWRPISFRQSERYDKKIQRLSPQSADVVIREGSVSDFGAFVILGYIRVG